ncbi:MAG TPA: class II aldolase/adducin family protein [Acidisphaera sp.]|nr:class II aldolase/adducin family protein [Acidisphaera sp.]
MRARSSTDKAEADLRRAIVDAARRMNALGINQGTSGNISARCGTRMLITPSATPYEDMRPEDLASMPLEGKRGEWSGPLAPSTEWRFHLDILRGRPDAGAVVHTHATYCTTLSILRREIPAVHYMIAAFGGPTIRCAPYALFGTEELAQLALQALQDRQACLLANHGMIVVGPTLARAMWLAVELETLARQYYLSLQAGEPVILSDAQIAEATAQFADYGLKERPQAANAAASGGSRSSAGAPRQRRAASRR